MNTRRSFLRLLGIGAVAAPAIATAAQVAAEAPLVEVCWSNDGGATYGPWQSLRAAQSEINARRSAMRAIVERSDNCRPLFGPGGLFEEPSHNGVPIRTVDSLDGHGAQR